MNPIIMNNMKKLVFATNNKHKLSELQAMLPLYTIAGLEAIGCSQDIPETADTLEGNALIKSSFVYQNFGLNCFADDTGLEVEALDGRPGVYSARYAGEDCNFEANIEKLLFEMHGKTNRKARFRTVISLLFDDKSIFFEGIVDGKITEIRKGFAGFGYDSVFIPDGYDISFAEMTPEQKNKISHRAKAVEKLMAYLLYEK